MECPECGNDQSLILSGWTMIPREEIFENGRLLETKNFKEAATFDIKQIYCLQCQTKVMIEDINTYNLQRTNLILNEKVRELSGEDPLMLGPVN
jgi:hypothetical protein